MKVKIQQQLFLRNNYHQPCLYALSSKGPSQLEVPCVMTFENRHRNFLNEILFYYFAPQSFFWKFTKVLRQHLKCCFCKIVLAYRVDTGRTDQLNQFLCFLLHMNIAEVVAPSSLLKKSKCKNSRELKNIQESFLRLGILINIILIKNLSINHGFTFPKIQEVSKKDISNQCSMQHNLSQFAIQKFTRIVLEFKTQEKIQ